MAPVLKTGRVVRPSGVQILSPPFDKIMKLRSHIVITLAISSMIYFAYNSLSLFISSLIGGILIDVDHLFDYYLHRGMDFRIRRFFAWCYKSQWNTLIIFLHSFELIVIFWLAISMLRLGLFWVGLAVGVSQHLILDMLFNSGRLSVFSYFFTFRFINGFKKEYIMRGIKDESC